MNRRQHIGITRILDNPDYPSIFRFGRGAVEVLQFEVQVSESLSILPERDNPPRFLRQHNQFSPVGSSKSLLRRWRRPRFFRTESVRLKQDMH